jgi:hypothetical protein
MTDVVSRLTAALSDRYRVARELGAGGMATVHLGRLMGPVGFSRTVAIKRLHAQFARIGQRGVQVHVFEAVRVAHHVVGDAA